MGGSSSKVSRRLPSKPSAPWAGARTDRSLLPSSQLPRDVVASETRTAAIERDAGDPQFMEKLKQLGPVKVDHRMAPVRTKDTHMRHVLQSREASEQQAASHQLPRNRLLASSLYDALEQRKATHSREELQEIANRHNIDPNIFGRIARYANTPSTLEETRRKVVDKEGSERFTILAAWQDPPLPSDSTRTS